MKKNVKIIIICSLTILFILLFMFYVYPSPYKYSKLDGFNFQKRENRITGKVEYHLEDKWISVDEINKQLESISMDPFYNYFKGDGNLTDKERSERMDNLIDGILNKIYEMKEEQ